MSARDELTPEDRALRDRLRTTASGSPERPEFRDELRDLVAAEWDTPGSSSATPPVRHVRQPARRTRPGLVLGAAAAVGALLVAGLALVARDASGPDLVVPADPSPAVTPVPSVSNTLEPVPTTTTVEEVMTEDASDTTVLDVSDPATTTTSLLNDEAIPEPAPSVNLADWDTTRPEPFALAGVPALLPAEPVPGAVEIIRSVADGSGTATYRHQQIFVIPDRSTTVRLETSVGVSDSTPSEFRSDSIEAPWTDRWADVYLVDQPEGSELLVLVAEGGIVRLTVVGDLETVPIYELAASLLRRSDMVGWDVPALPGGAVLAAEGGDGLTGLRSLIWRDAADASIAELTVGAIDPSRFPLFATDLIAEHVFDNGRSGWVFDDGSRTTIVWQVDDDVQAEFVVSDRLPVGGDSGPAVRLQVATSFAEEFSEVDLATWEAATREFRADEDGCQGLNC